MVDNPAFWWLRGEQGNRSGYEGDRLELNLCCLLLAVSCLLTEV